MQLIVQRLQDDVASLIDTLNKKNATIDRLMLELDEKKEEIRHLKNFYRQLREYYSQLKMIFTLLSHSHRILGCIRRLHWFTRICSLMDE